MAKRKGAKVASATKPTKGAATTGTSRTSKKKAASPAAARPRRVAKSRRAPKQRQSAPSSPPVVLAEVSENPPPAIDMAKVAYDPGGIEDAPEFSGMSRAMGTMSWGTWDTDARPFEERIRDFVFAYPPEAPTKRVGGRLVTQPDGSFAPGDDARRMERFLSNGWQPGSLHELLSRFGLRMKKRPPLVVVSTSLEPVRDVAKRRNVRLRVLHGGVDVEPTNMDAAKAEYLDRQEKQQAARDVRAARSRMMRELDGTEPDKP